MFKLLIRADDFGLSQGTNEGILESVRAGLVRNVGVMATGPALEYQLDELLALSEKACIGLHATLNSEWAHLRWGPISAPESLHGLVREDGTFHESIGKTHRFGEPEEGVREIRAQLERIRTLGLDPLYLDCHMFFNWHPDWDRAVGKLAHEEGLIYHANRMMHSLRCEIADRPYPKARDVLHIMKADGVTAAVWVFHPAKTDSASAKLYMDPAVPSNQVAQAREREQSFLTDADSIRSFHSSSELLLVRYDELLKHQDPRAEACL